MDVDVCPPCMAAQVRAREEEVGEKLRRQQRDVENCAFEHRQRILREEERLRAWKAEALSLLEGQVCAVNTTLCLLSPCSFAF